MANNVFQVKRTNVSGRTPNTTGSYGTNSQYIAAGEFALNMADGILYSSNGSAVIEVGANNTTQRVTGTLTVNAISANGGVGTSGQVLKSNGSSTYWATDNADVGAANQILYRNSSNTLTSSSGLVYDGTSIKVNGNLESVYQNGDEGGEIFLNKPVNTSITTGVTIDIYQNKIRFFEAGGTNRGAYIDITAASTGIGTNLLSGGGGGGSVNVDAQYVWTNLHSFNANVSIFANAIGLTSNTTSLYFAGVSDGNWRMGRNTNAVTKWIYTNNSIDIAIANSNLEGFVIGNAITKANTYFETGHLGTYIAANLTIGNSSSNSTINSTAFSGTANAATYLGAVGNFGNSSGIYTSGVSNAATLSTGTTFIANATQVTFAVPLSSNGGTGSSGQVLTSNGATGSPYWAAATGGGYYKGGSSTVGTLAVGGANIFRVNANTLNNNTTIATGENAQATGPLAVASGITLTVESGARVAIV